MAKSDTIAVILAAGEGKRMKSSVSKVAHSICGRSVVRWVYCAVKDAGIENTVVVVGHRKDQVKECMGNEVSYAIQDKQLGTGHAVMSAADSFRNMAGNVLLLCGDAPLLTASTIKRALRYHNDGGNAATVVTALLENPEGYGRIIRDEKANVKRIVEQRDADDEQKSIREVNSGTYIFDAQKLAVFLEKLGNSNAQGEYYLTDTIGLLIDDGLRVGAVKVQDPAEIMGINDRVQLSEASGILRRRILNSIMLSGVTVTDPGSTYIDADVRVGSDSVIYPGTILEGDVDTGTECILGPDTRMKNVKAGKGSQIRNSVVLDSSIGDGCSIGPFAYIRPGSCIGDNVRIGDFVEVKNSVIGSDSKISHLTYVGDADIGRNVNLGCGVVFVNYDGKVKNRTVVGDNAFIGCNVNLIAPVVVEKDSYIAAGSTINRTVPEKALAVARQRQSNIENWVERRGMKRGK